MIFICLLSLAHFTSTSAIRCRRVQASEKSQAKLSAITCLLIQIVKPSRYNFHEIFSKPGVHLFNQHAIPVEALKPSMLTDQLPPDLPLQEPPTPTSSTVAIRPLTVDEILQLPTVQTKQISTRKRKGDSRARLLTSLNSDNFDEPVASSSTSTCAPCTSKAKAATSKSKRSKVDDNGEEDWICGECNVKFSDDVKRETGTNCVQCSFCLISSRKMCTCISESLEKDGLLIDKTINAFMIFIVITTLNVL